MRQAAVPGSGAIECGGRRGAPARARWWAAPLVASLLLSGCSLEKLAVRKLGKALAASGETYAGDDDPELVAGALPFALKTIEGLLASDPTNRDLLLASARGFTQYAYAFVQGPADRLPQEEFERAEQQRQRALRLFLRARGYGLRGLETAHPGISARLASGPEAAAELARADVELAYWTAAAWGAAISVGKDRPELIADLPTVRGMLERVLALDEGWGNGAIHQAFIALDAVSPALGGNPESAKRHFARAVEITGGRDASPYVAYAESIAMPAQDRQTFDEMLNKALAVDPDAVTNLRLSNILAQQKARFLLDHAEDYFLGDEPAAEEEPASDESSPEASSEEGATETPAEDGDAGDDGDPL